MSSMSGVWPSIARMAGSGGIPNKPRAVLREYLQLKALDFLYAQKNSDNLAFVGGTSLRLLYDLPRFSEDLDFDNLGISDGEVIALVEQIISRFEGENIPVELFEKNSEGKTYFELRFPELLKELAISTNPKEKLMIKIDYAGQWKGQVTRVMPMIKLGVVQNVVTNTMDQLLVEKLAAYVGRTSVQPRDMYDVVWLYGQGARLDRDFMGANGMGDLLEKARVRTAEVKVSEEMKRKLTPFLFVESDALKLDIFPEVIRKMEEN